MGSSPTRPTFQSSESSIELLHLDLRTRQFAPHIIRLCEASQEVVPPQLIGKQLLRSGTSVGANHCEARRAKSNPDFMLSSTRSHQ
ncbi:MAG: four helix bundle protein [Candidatus Roseilinea sp.]|uniref:four helix bundle protein n=1 Tax=Candidatus Roseilinea sp. TaxID=2838777 RepID=UPI00404A7B2A